MLPRSRWFAARNDAALDAELALDAFDRVKIVAFQEGTAFTARMRIGHPDIALFG